jgi:hypothetical protein
MARVNALYDTARERLATAGLNWPSATMVMTAWTGNPDTSFVPTHLTQANLGTPAAVSQPLLAPTVMPGGYCRTSYANFLTIPMGAAIQFFVLCEDNAAPASRKLIAYLADTTGLPLVPNGLGYLVKPDWLFSQGWFRA